ncbi:uncharacterized protein [Eurosta solidaginis]|uniref:uncharacterized protein n=1 Tax=Eurosta solidaginis TaxID=178769 RepID=UPI00353106E2
MFFCFKCHKNFSEADALICHFKVYHKLSTKLLRLRCKQDNCNQLFTKFSSFRNHLQNIHTKFESTSAQNVAPTEDMLLPILSNSSSTETETQDGANLSVQNIVNETKNLKKKALYLSLSLYAQNNLPRKQVIDIQSMVSSLLSSISFIIHNVLNSEAISDINDDLQLLLEFCKNPFQDISSEYRLFKILKELNLYEHPKTITIKESVTETTKYGIPTLAPKSFDIYIMPLNFQFKAIFEIPCLLQSTLQNTEKYLKESSIQNFVSGRIFKARKDKIQSELVIPYILYFDDFQINNALGSHTYSICGCYYSFPSMPKHLLSKLQYIFHGAFISTKTVKSSGVENSFLYLVHELKLLEEGIEIVTENGSKKVHFVLGLVIGDNLAVNSIMGFVQSFNSKRFCRVCTRTKDQMRSDVSEEQEALRNEENYYKDLSENNYQETGIREVCVFDNLKYFSVTENFTFDLMHDVFEGVCIYDVCNVLLNLIKDEVITLDIINSRKQFFQFGEIEIGNKSPPLEAGRLSNYNLKMSASEVACFIHFLPLMIGDLIPRDNEHWKFFLILTQIIEYILKPQIATEELVVLEELIKAQTSFSCALPHSY